MDDVILNGSGALIGALAAPLVLWWMPRARVLAAERGLPRPVTVMRRWVGMVVDLVLAWIVAGVVGVGALVARDLLGGQVEPTFAGSIGPAAMLAAWLVVFVWPAWSGSGASAGQAAVWLTPVWRDRAGDWGWGSRAQRVARASVLPGAVFLGSLTGSGIGIVATLLLVAAVASVPFTRGRRGLTCALTGAEMRDWRAVQAPVRLVEDTPDGRGIRSTATGRFRS